MNEVTKLSQRDPIWANKNLGFTTGGSTIGGYGCLTTCFTMLSGWTDVGQMNEFRKANGGYYNLDYASTFDLIGSARGLKYTDCTDTWIRKPVPEDEIRRYLKWLEAGNYCIVEVNWNRKWRPWLWRFQYAQHFTVVVPGGQMHDPWELPVDQNTPRNLYPNYGDTLAEAIVRVVYYEKTTK